MIIPPHLLQYHTVPGTKAVIPIMTLGEDLMKLSLSGKKSDPVAEATKDGRIPTLGEVKRSLKVGDKRRWPNRRVTDGMTF